MEKDNDYYKNILNTLLINIYNINKEINDPIDCLYFINNNFMKLNKEELTINKNKIYIEIIEIIINKLKENYKIKNNLINNNNFENSQNLENILYDLIILYLIFFDNKNILSKIFIFNDIQSQLYIIEKIKLYINFDDYANTTNNKEKNYLILSLKNFNNLLNKFSLYEDKFLNFENDLNNLQKYSKLTQSPINPTNLNDIFEKSPGSFLNKNFKINSSNKDLSFDLNYLRLKDKLNEQDYCKIILKKDFMINQLQNQIESNISVIKDVISEDKEEENNQQENEIDYQNYIDELKEDIEYYKKENEDYKKKYEAEFELMASAMYNLGTMFLKYKEDLNNTMIKEGWIYSQKKSLI